jgi:DNA transformation protein and related proteins
MPGDPDRFDDLFAPFGKIVVRRMFGAEGLFRDGLMFGIVYRERIYFKTNEDSRQAFIVEGASPLYYEFKSAEGVLTSYYELPDRLYDDPDELTEWARAAFAVARNKSAAKRKTGSGRKAKKKPSPAAKKKKPKKRR